MTTRSRSRALAHDTTYDGDQSDVSHVTRSLMRRRSAKDLEEEKGPARPRIPCPQCDDTFSRRDLMMKHRNRDHRTAFGHNPPVYKPLDTIPADITEVKVITLYFFERNSKNKIDCPPGYDPDLMPLAKVTYFHGSGSTSPLIVRYASIRERVPRDINNLFI